MRSASASSFGPTHLFADYLHHTPGHARGRVARLALGHHGAQRGRRAGRHRAGVAVLRAVARHPRAARARRSIRSTRCRSTSFISTRSSSGCSSRRCAAWPGSRVGSTRRVIDRIVDGVGGVPLVLSRVPVFVHNGLVSTYALVMLGGVVVCVLVVLKVCLNEIEALRSKLRR